ncbi:hypothetical protein GX51_02654 [Blastomyces parvus]|uniref:BZIP domain-containing protein n=1 Tax=Blastomyces parvus TaxID=2060905 RepID=A0A2B7XA63_9EURO|nr:hypothetical protein GX51_02654 [Blastomyces parvus]
MSRGSSHWASSVDRWRRNLSPQPIFSHPSTRPPTNQLHKYQDPNPYAPKPRYPNTSSMQPGVQSANINKNSSNDATSPDAIRIRDNQRRSRARRKEYQQDLERRVQKFEQQGVQATIEVQAAARKVARENTLLRSLLKLKGVATVEIDEYVSNAMGSENGADATLNGAGNAKANVNGNSNGAGIGFAQLQPATSPVSTTTSSSVSQPTPTAAVFPNTMNQNQSHSEGQNENQHPIQLDNYPSYYPAEQAPINPSPQYVEPPGGQNIPGSVSSSAPISASTSIYSPTASFTSATLSPSTNSDQHCQPQHSSYPSYAPPIPYTASRYPQGPPQQDHQQQQQQQKQHQPQSQPLQLPLQLVPPVPSNQPHPYRPSPSHTHIHPNQPHPQLLNAQAPCSSSTDTIDSTSCEVAASIIASMRGHGDADSVRAELGCHPGGAPCQVGNMEIFSVLDRSIGSCR